MQAIVYEEYGPPEVLQLKEIEKPTPKDKEVLIRNFASIVNYGDLIARNFKNIPTREFHMPLLLWLPARLAFGMNKPKKTILGNTFAGEIESVGKGVNRFKAGDPVFGYRGQSMGCYAEYLCVPEESVVAIKPANMIFKEAAAVPYGALMASTILKKVKIESGQKVLINGASGGIGSAAVQLAKISGAVVTGVCGSPRLEFVKKLGADHVIDYMKEDFTQRGEIYDLIFDILGKSPFSRCKTSLSENGRYLLASFKMRPLLQMLWTKMRGNKKVICAMASDKQEDLLIIKELIEAGKIKSIIDKSYPLEQAAEAHRYIETGQNKGPVVLTIGHNDKSR